MEALRRTRKKAPGNVPTLLALGEACAALKLWAEAAEAASSAIGITRDATERLSAAVLLAEAHAELPEQRDAARRETRDAERSALGLEPPLRAPWLIRISAIHRALGDTEAANGAVFRAVVEGKSNPRPLAALSELYPATTYEGARAYARAVLQVIELAKSLGAPCDASWLAALGKVEATVLSQPREGLLRIREAVRLAPARLSTYETLAEVYTALGSHDDAARELLTMVKETLTGPPEGALGVLRLLARECKLSRRVLQAASADELAAYFARELDIGPHQSERSRRIAHHSRFGTRRTILVARDHRRTASPRIGMQAAARTCARAL